MPFTFQPTMLPDVLLIEPKVFEDSRGFFAEIFKADEFIPHVGLGHFVQVNHSYSGHKVLRGLHYQMMPFAQDKLVYVPSGEIFDVAVDIRQGSPTYGLWTGEILSGQNRRMLYIPAGFAHGFCVLSHGADVIYFCSKIYAPDRERTILWNDPQINIHWPVKEPVFSPRDSAGCLLAQVDNNFSYEKSSK